MTMLDTLLTEPAQERGRPLAWLPVVRFDELQPDRGVAALVGGEQVAVFRLSGTDEVFALANKDPFSGANVMSRGIVGDRAGVAKVASPVYKQSFELRTGICLDDPTVHLHTYDSRVVDGWVEIASPAS